MPLHEICIDCWNTLKGETQSCVYFRPVEEPRASAAVSRLARSHVISNHPGFDSQIAVGALTFNMQHKMTSSQTASLVGAKDSTSSLLSINSASTNINNNSSSDEEGKAQLTSLSNKNIVEKIVDELIEQNSMQSEFNRRERDLLSNINSSINGTSAGGTLSNGIVDNDISIHRFISVQFNEGVTCEFCNKKVVILFYTVSISYYTNKLSKFFI
jgi:hypothetical protein